MCGDLCDGSRLMNRQKSIEFLSRDSSCCQVTWRSIISCVRVRVCVCTKTFPECSLVSVGRPAARLGGPWLPLSTLPISSSPLLPTSPPVKRVIWSSTSLSVPSPRWAIPSSTLLLPLLPASLADRSPSTMWSPRPPRVPAAAPGRPPVQFRTPYRLCPFVVHLRAVPDSRSAYVSIVTPPSAPNPLHTPVRFSVRPTRDDSSVTRSTLRTSLRQLLLLLLLPPGPCLWTPAWPTSTAAVVRLLVLLLLSTVSFTPSYQRVGSHLSPRLLCPCRLFLDPFSACHSLASLLSLSSLSRLCAPRF